MPQNKYLVVQLARMGDLIQSKRLILSLESAGEVCLLVDHSLRELAGIIYPGARILTLPAHGGKQFRPAERLEKIQAVFKALLAEDFDQVYNLNFSGLNFSLARLFPPEKTQGYLMINGQPSKSKWTRMAFNLTRSRAKSPINLVDLWGLHAPEPVHPDRINPCPGPGGDELAVVLAGRNQRRSIPAQVLSGLIFSLLQRTSASSAVLLGGGQDRAKAAELKKYLPRSISRSLKDLTGKTSWSDLVDKIGSSAAVLTPDTGPMHLAAHLGVPVWAFFFSSAWCFETGPYGSGHNIFQTVPACAPCLENRPCRFKMKCHKLLADPELLRFILKKTAQPPEDILYMRSEIDCLGTIYNPVCGEDPYRLQRGQLRECLYAYHFPDQDRHFFIGPEAAGYIYPEREWMLPD